MHTQTLDKVTKVAIQKVEFMNRTLLGYLIFSAFAGIYIGFGIALIFSIGAPLASAQSIFTKALMGAGFGVALTLVVFAGAELFTGNNMFLLTGALSGRTSWRNLFKLFWWCYVGNLLGSIALAWLVVQSGVMSSESPRWFITSVASMKMSLPFWEIFLRAVLANWLVCLAIWMSARTKNDAAKLIVIWWALFAFVASGYEHVVANMSLLSMALFLPHDETVTWFGFAYNLIPATLGNFVGGGLFVGGLYWLASPIKNFEQEIEMKSHVQMKPETE
jgi:nitrite transporter NirC